MGKFVASACTCVILLTKTYFSFIALFQKTMLHRAGVNIILLIAFHFFGTDSNPNFPPIGHGVEVLNITALKEDLQIFTKFFENDKPIDKNLSKLLTASKNIGISLFHGFSLNDIVSLFRSHIMCGFETP